MVVRLSRALGRGVLESPTKPKALGSLPRPPEGRGRALAERWGPDRGDRSSRRGAGASPTETRGPQGFFRALSKTPLGCFSKATRSPIAVRQ